MPLQRFPAICRHHLLEGLGLDPSTIPSLTVLEAPTGYGKTILASQWARALDASGVVVRWMSIPGEVEDEWLHARLGEEQDWVSGLTTPTLLVIDSFQPALSPKAAGLVLEYVQQNDMLHVLVGTRRSAGLARRAADQMISVNVLGREELRFNDEEMRKIVGDQIGAKMAEEFAGWPLATQALASSTTEARSTVAHLAEGLLAMGTAPLAQLAATAVAVCRNISLSVLANALGVSEAEAIGVIEELEDAGVIFESTDERYVCVEGLIEPFTSRAESVWTGGALRELRRHHALDVAGIDPASAIEILLELNLLDDAEAISDERMVAILDDHERIRHLLRSLPLDDIANHSSLLLARLIVERSAPSTPIETIKSIATRLRDVTQRQIQDVSPEQWPATATRLAVAHRVLGEWAAAEALLHEVLVRSEDPSIKAGPILFAASALTGILVGDLEFARTAATRGLNIARAEDDPREQAHALGLLALANALSSDRVTEGEQLLAEVDELVATNNLSFVEYSWVDAELARLVLANYRDDRVTAHAVLDRLIPELDRMEQAPLIILAESTTMRLDHWAIEALRLLEQRRETTNPASPFVERLLQLRHADFAVQAGNYSLAQELLRTMTQRDGTFYAVQARLALALENFEAARTLTEEGLRLDISDLRRDELKLIRIMCRFRTGDEEGACLAFKEISPTSLILNAVPYEDLADLADACAKRGMPELSKTLATAPASTHWDRYGELTATELKVLRALHNHGSPARAAQELFVSTNTIKFHQRGIYQKLRVSSRTDALTTAARLGLLR